MKSFNAFLQIATLGTLASHVQAHSWVEQLMNIAPNGTMVGKPGYSRGNIKRGTPGFSDPAMINLIPPNGRVINTIYESDMMCRSSQTTQNQTDGSPRLQTIPGGNVALRYQENGHVTIPQNIVGKPPHSGTVYVYGTTQPKTDEKFLDIHRVWTPDGKGGDGRGVLLSTQNFDDGQCYQINNKAISLQRQKEFAHTADTLMGADLWCQQDIQIPATAPTGKPYTLYWVWDWPTLPGSPGFPEGKQEMYTSCIDVDIVDDGGSLSKLIGGVLDGITSGFVVGQNFADAAIQDQLKDIANPTAVVGSTIPFKVASGTPTGEKTTVDPSIITEHSSVAATPQPTSGGNQHGHGHGHGHGQDGSSSSSPPAPTPAPAANTGTAIGAAPAPGVNVSTKTEYESVFETVYETVYQKRSAAPQTEAPHLTASARAVKPTVACSRGHKAFRLKVRNPFVLVPPSGEPVEVEC